MPPITPNPTTRVLALLELLLTHRALSGSEIARHLEIDARTVRRYIDKLQDLGIPVLAERGRYGTYRLVSGYRLPPMVFNDDEALALSLGLHAAAQLKLGATRLGIESAQAKLTRVLPERLKDMLRAVTATVQLNLGSGGAAKLEAEAAAFDGEHLLVLSRSAQTGTALQLAYRSAQGQPSTRRFDCYGLAWHAGCWYGVGWCHLRAALRSFRLDRIVSLQPLAQRFTPPDAFDPVQYVVRSMALIPRAHAVRVRLEVDIGTAQAAMFDSLGVLQAAGRSTLLYSQADDLDWYARELARLPFDFSIEAPAALRSALARHARRLSARSRPVRILDGTA